MKKILALAATLLTGSALVACSGGDAPLTPAGPAADRSPTAAVVSTVTVLQRLAPLSAPVSENAKIGRSGGTIEIPAAGLRVIFPEGAVTKPTTITVTAHAGSNVAYTFHPHGLVFQVPVSVHQDAKLTQAWKNTVFTGSRGAYVQDGSLDGTSAEVTEFRPTTYDLHGAKFHWTVEHFSGYLLSVP